MRLLKFKRQLSNFNEHFEFRSDSTYALLIGKPVLTGSDIDGLMEVEPTRCLDDSHGQWRLYEYEKVPSDGSQPMVYGLVFRDDKLVEICFPAQFSQLYPAPALQELLHVLGEAEVEKKQKSAHSKVFDPELRSQLPGCATVLAALGEPSEWDLNAKGAEELLYRYRLRTVTAGEKERKRRAYGRFTFGNDGQLQRVDAGIGRHELRFDIPLDPAPEPE